jgi:hypothetical protein
MLINDGGWKRQRILGYCAHSPTHVRMHDEKGFPEYRFYLSLSAVGASAGLQP